jgi:FtsH-binding integral membrane protein
MKTVLFLTSIFIISPVFLKVDKNKNRIVHYLVSLHGILIVLAYLLAWLVSEYDLSQIWSMPFLGLIIGAVISIVISFKRFTGDSAFLVLHIVTFLGCLLVFFLGGMFISGEYL